MAATSKMMLFTFFNLHLVYVSGIIFWWIDGWIKAWINEKIMDGWMDGWGSEWVHNCTLTSILYYIKV